MAVDTGGNQKVDFVWGPFPPQPDTGRETALDAGVGFHAMLKAAYNGFPDYTPVAPFLDEIANVAVPNVVGKTESAANTDLVAAGLVKGAVSTTGVGATTVNDGKVKTQTPAAATVVNTGTSVALVKHLAPTVPDVTGLTESAANTALVAVGLVKGAVTTADNAAGATAENDGTIKSQTPASGGKADTGSSVALVKYAYTAG